MQPLQDTSRAYYAEAFKDKQVVDAYAYRPPYPQDVFALLATLIIDEPKSILDVGSGAGNIARPLAEVATRVDAVDFSRNMIERGKQLPGGNHPQLHWIYGKIEEVELTPPYALITAGASIHWPAWEIAFPRFRQMLTPRGSLALIYRRTLPMPWEPGIRKIFVQFSEWSDDRGANAVKELATQGFFRKRGEQTTAPVPFVQAIDDYIEGLHSRSNFSRERMGQEKADDFDRQIRALLQQFHPDGILSFQVVASVTWGTPENGKREKPI